MHMGIQPPNAPWQLLDNVHSTEGCISVYLSDPLSRLPVRAVALKENNKSDPNIETRTYGVFSTCSRGMRGSVVNRRLRYIFFMTRWHGERVLTGYYRISWFAPGPLNGAVSDYCLAADEMRFLWPPIRLVELPTRIRQEASKRFRLVKLLTSDISERLYKLMMDRPDASSSYLSEIDRLERFNYFRTGYRYVGWKQPDKFDWALAAKYLSSDKVGSTAPSNSSPSNMWVCTACKEHVFNKALLKRCPHCGRFATLQPLNR